MTVASSDIDLLSKRITYFRKAFVRGLGRKPNPIEQLAIRNAAILTARAEAAANDPNTSANDLVRLSNAAERSRSTMTATLNAHKQRQSPLSAFDQYVLKKGASA